MGEARSSSPAGPWGFVSVRCVAAPPVTPARCLGCVFTGSVCLLPKAFDHNLHNPEGALSFTLPPAQLQVKPDPVGRNWEPPTSQPGQISAGTGRLGRDALSVGAEPSADGGRQPLLCGTTASRGCRAQGRVSLPHAEAKGRRGHLGHTGLGLLPPPLQQVAPLARKCWGTGGPCAPRPGQVHSLPWRAGARAPRFHSTRAPLRTWHSVS